ncbi:MAG: SCO family protein, partial [Gammaproteobacteria bacterium]
MGAPALAELSAERALGKSRAALGRSVADHHLLDATGMEFSLAELRGEPLIVNPVFTSCHQICPALTSHLAKMVELAREALGSDRFNVLTVGFDVAVDSPERMASFAAQRGIDDPRWRFASGSADAVNGLLADIGFSYEPSPRGFDHLLQTTILDADGRVFRHIYGGTFDLPLVVEPLRALALDTPSTTGGLKQLIEKVRLFCTVYDPSAGRYRFDYSVLVAAVVGGFCLMGLA